MADDILNLNIDIAKVGGSVQAFGDIMLWIFFAALLLGVLFLILHIMKYKHKAHIMDLTGSSIIHHRDRARIWKDRHGILWFKLFKRKYKTKVPTADSKGITDKGKYHFDLYYTDDGGYSFADQRSQHIKEKLLAFKDKNSLVSNTDPWSTEDRTLLILQQEESNQFKNFSWKDWITQNGGVLITGMTLIMLIIVFTIAIDVLMPHISEISADRAMESQANKVLGDAINRMVDYMNSTQIPISVPVAPQ